MVLPFGLCSVASTFKNEWVESEQGVPEYAGSFKSGNAFFFLDIYSILFVTCIGATSMPMATPRASISSKRLKLVSYNSLEAIP
jgi:hypothetical protein